MQGKLTTRNMTPAAGAFVPKTARISLQNPFISFKPPEHPATTP